MRKDPDHLFRILGTVAFVAIAALRAQTLAPDLWEWDEILLTEAVRSGIDLRVNHPHAPGYPLFVELAQGVAALGLTPFRAATLVGAVGSLLAALGTTWLLASFGIATRYAVFAGVLYALIPAVWLHGVRPLTDGLGAAGFLFAAGCLVRSVRSRNVVWFVAGVGAAAFATGVRPQVGLALLPLAAVCGWPLVRTRSGMASVCGGGLLAGALTLVIWLPAVRGSGGWVAFRSRVRQQATYVTEADALKPHDLVTARVWTRWWRDPFGRTGTLIAILLLSLVALAGTPAVALRLVLVFLPLVGINMCFGRLAAAPRYSAALLPLLACLVSLGLAHLAARFGRWPSAALGTALLAVLAHTAAPSVVLVATRTSPPMALVKVLRDESRFRGRPVVYNAPLFVHMSALLPGVARREFREGEPMAVNATELVAAADIALFGVQAVRRFSFDEPWLSRISGTRYLSTALYDGISGVGIVTARVEGRAFSDRAGEAEIAAAGALVLRCIEGPVHVSFRAVAAANGAVLRLATDGAIRDVRLSPATSSRLTVSATPSSEEQLLRISSISGTVFLTHFRFTAPPSHREMRRDEDLPVAVDQPSEGAVVLRRIVITGWCQEVGGGEVYPEEFRIDGIRVHPTSLRRTERGDVAAAVPGIGDTSRAGFEAVLPPLDLSPGAHRLTVVFATRDGRQRAYPPRVFVVAERGR